jgi:hypothetical protein
LLVEVPRGVHHLGEVGVTVDAGRHIGVVFHPLFHRDLAIGLFILPCCVVGFEVLEELIINLSLGLAALYNSWVLLSAVTVLNVFVVDYAAAVTVKGLESALDEV